jgi:hypothetical protein
MTHPHFYRTTHRQELSAGGRLGAKRQGPYTGSWSLWTGRPPAATPDGNPKVICIAMRVDDPSLLDVTSRSISIRAECGNGDGGIITREFIVGEGVSVDLRVGAFRHVRVVTTSAIPAGSTIYFSWAEDLPFSSSEFTLLNFLDYPTANARVALPEGCTEICPEQACTLTWTLTSLGTTFTQSAGAGTFTPVKWGTVQANVVTKFITRLRGF